MKQIKLFVTVISLILFLTGNLFSQITNKQSLHTDKSSKKETYTLSERDMLNLKSIPQFQPNESQLLLKTNLPAYHDNSTEIFMRPIFNDIAFECGQASGVGLTFTYEINYMRNLAGNVPENQYPTHFVYNFHNSGQTYMGASYFDSWQLIKEMGTPTVQEYGGMHVTGDLANIAWPTGYEMYYNAMKNRVLDIFAIDCKTESGLNILKQWLFDHADGSSSGGIANFYSTYIGNGGMESLPTGTPEGGKYVVEEWGGVNHGMTIVGWNDSIRWDYNNDGQYTNNIDINSDGVVDLKDWEIGGLIFTNTYGNSGGTSWGDNGFAYMMYSTLAKDVYSGGIWNQAVHIITTKESYDPLLTMKIGLNHNSRNKLKIWVGVASDTSATEAEHIKEFTAFDYRGGDFYMQGDTTESAKNIEIGLDLSPLLNHVNPGDEAKFFLMIDENDPGNSSTGYVSYFSLIDYTNSAYETVYPSTNIPFVENGTLTVSLKTSPNHGTVNILSDTLLPAIVNAPYSDNINASGGTPPYTYDLIYNYSENISSQTFPTTSAQQIYTSGADDGYAVFPLDFEFPFYGEKHDTIAIYNDGFMLFAKEDFEWIYDKDYMLLFKLHQSISPFYCDLRYSLSQGDGIWYEGDNTKATFRCHGYIDGQSGSDINYAISLYPSGKIEIFYGDIIISNYKEWIGGISDGTGRQYQLFELSNEQSISSGTKIELIPPSYPEELTFNYSGNYSGIVQHQYLPINLRIRVTDNNDLISEKDVVFTTDGINSLFLTNYMVESGGDNKIEFGETCNLSIELSNMESVDLTNLELILTLNDSYFTLIDSIENIALIQGNNTEIVSNAFSFAVSNDVPDSYTFDANITAFSANDTSEMQISLNAFNIDLSIGGITVLDGNNSFLEAGETSAIGILMENSGGARATNPLLEIFTYDPYITINQNTSQLNAIQSNSVDTFILNIAASTTTPLMHIAGFEIFASAQNSVTITDSAFLVIGVGAEDYETADFLYYDWQLSGDENWLIATDTVFEGAYSAKSGDIDDDEESLLSIEIDVIAPGSISFYKKVSCEDDQNDNYDYLLFSINGNEIGRWDGEVSWSLSEYPVSSGVNTFSWLYHKDYSVSNGSDCAWIDMIKFPPHSKIVGTLTAAISANDSTICMGDSVLLFGFPDGGSGDYSYTWHPGNIFTDASAKNTVAYPIVNTDIHLTITDSAGATFDTSYYVYTLDPPPAPKIVQSGDILFSTASDGNQWYSVDSIIPGANDVSYTPEGSGQFYIIVTDSNGCNSLPSEIFHFIHSFVNQSDFDEYKVYPNPFSSNFNIEFYESETQILRIELVDIDGKAISIYEKNEFSGNKATISSDVLFANINPGTYFLNITTDRNKYKSKIVKLK